MESIFYGVHLNLGGAKLMVVDKDRATRKAIVSILARQGFQILEASSGEEAIEKALNEDPDLVLLDVKLGEMDGFETCQRFKETPKINEIPIIFLTSQSEMKSILHGFSSGGADYIIKPFNPIEALARISAHIQVRLLNKSQRKLIEALSKANDAKTKMIGVASHDLRGPLGSIKELTKLMVDGTIGNFTEEQQELINTIQQSSDSMLGLVNNLLDISMIETDEVQLDLEPLNLEELIQHCVELQKINANKKSIELKYVNHGLFGAIECDRRQIIRVLDNLISNAIKYSPFDRLVTVSSIRVGDHILVQVEDQGRGIPEGEMHKLFKEYGTTSVKPTGGEISTGLGLSICKKIMTRHDGRIRVENRAEGGLRCQIEFPVKQTQNSTASGQQPAEPSSPKSVCITQASDSRTGHSILHPHDKKSLCQDVTFQ